QRCLVLGKLLGGHLGLVQQRLQPFLDAVGVVLRLLRRPVRLRFGFLRAVRLGLLRRGRLGFLVGGLALLPRFQGLGVLAGRGQRVGLRGQLVEGVLAVGMRLDDRLVAPRGNRHAPLEFEGILVGKRRRFRRIALGLHGRTVRRRRRRLGGVSFL